MSEYIAGFEARAIRIVTHLRSGGLFSELSPDDRKMAEALNQISTNEHDWMANITDERMKIVCSGVNQAKGLCFLWLVCTLPGFPSVNHETLRKSIGHMIVKVGPNGRGGDIVLELIRVEEFFRTNDEGSLTKVVPDALASVLNSEGTGDLELDNLELLDRMYLSGVRFEYSEDNHLFHITKTSGYHCGCSPGEILCEHGWNARFLIVTVIGTNSRLGGTIDFNQLLEGGYKFPEMEEMPDLSKFETQPQKEAALNASRIKDKSMIESDIMSFVETLKPDDSSSCIDRYGRRFVKPGSIIQRHDSVSSEKFNETDSFVIDDSETVLTITGGNEFREIPMSVAPLDLERKVIRGFLRTEEINARERRAVKGVCTINGLNNPFKSNRLNFLCHFMTTFGSTRNKTPSVLYDRLVRSVGSKSKTPTDLLTHMVVSSTFDFRQNVIIANPFKLPYISIGMHLSDSCLVKCFNMLWLEYKVLWFEQMNDLLIPNFHSDYDEMDTRKVTIRVDHGKSSRSEFQRKPQGDKKQKAKSILGF